MSEVLFIIGCALWLINLIYWSVIQLTVSGIRSKDEAGTTMSTADLIIVTHNDLGELQRNIDGWLAQTYPNLNIVIADDGSTDGTREWFEEKSWQNVSYIHYPKSTPGKKKTLSSAIAGSTADFIILTDADGRPNSDEWVDIMVGKMASEGTDICLGYGPYIPSPGSFLNKLIRFETALTALQYLTWARNGMPYMVVGRNVAYRRSILDSFYERSVPSLASGDDDLFIQNISQPVGISLCLDPRAFVYSKPPGSLRKWLDQKARHTTTAYEYPLVTQSILSIFAVSQIAWYLILLGPPTVWAALIGVRYAILYLSGRHSFGKLAVGDLQCMRPLLDPGLAISYLLILVLSLFRKRDKW